MPTVEFVSAIVSLIVVGGLIFWGGLLANATLVAEVLIHTRTVRPRHDARRHPSAGVPGDFVNPRL
jgi:hypothetical protein